MKVYGGVHVYFHIFLPFAWMEVSGQLNPLGKEPPVPIGYEAGWDPEPVWTTWRKFLTLTGLEL
jgi:hypothetical protein